MDPKPLDGGGLTNLVEFSTPYYIPSTYEEKEAQDHQASKGTAVFRAKPQHNLMSSVSKVLTAPLNLMRSDSINPSSLMLKESSIAARVDRVDSNVDVKRDNSLIEPMYRMESPKSFL